MRGSAAAGSKVTGIMVAALAGMTWCVASVASRSSVRVSSNGINPDGQTVEWPASACDYRVGGGRVRTLGTVQLPNGVVLPYAVQGSSGIPLLLVHAVGDSWHAFYWEDPGRVARDLADCVGEIAAR